MRFLGLEWGWRLIVHKGKDKEDRKKRLKRIKNAVIIFPWEFIKWRFIQPFLYRPNVACLLYKKEKRSEYKILLVERSEFSGHWQLPQGGTDGEDLITAGKKEAREEIGCDKFEYRASFKKLYKYTFDLQQEKNIHRGKICKRHAGYKGQKQGLFIAEFFGKDEDIKINFWDHSRYKWVDSKKLVDEVHFSRSESAKIFLELFNKNL